MVEQDSLTQVIAREAGAMTPMRHAGTIASLLVAFAVWGAFLVAVAFGQERAGDVERLKKQTKELKAQVEELQRTLDQLKVRLKASQLSSRLNSRAGAFTISALTFMPRPSRR